ncbi:MAG: hypothetical protein FWG99_04640 [Treponema sp.]|nr:hypothetical protein [Treponema sp.]
MKKAVLTIVFLAVAAGVFAQRLPSVGIFPLEAGPGVTPGDAANMTGQVVSELRSWGTLMILQGADAAGAEYTIRGGLSRQGNNYILSAVTMETSTNRTLNQSLERAPALSGISIAAFSTSLMENVPFPNYLLGKWQSTINMPDGPIVCIMEFRSNRTVEVEKFDTWEHRNLNALKYEGYGSGTYSYAGYARRMMTIQDAQGNSRQVQVDATVGVSLKLEETLTEQANINQGGLRLLFNETRTSFEILNAGILCGRNYDGAAYYPSSTIAFTRFNKIQ